MKFACVEYTTKTGRIWRPTPERPNYLGDPEREIDPTSFGCYTSALSGEHLPLTGLIYGSLERPPSALRRLRQDAVKRATGSFAEYSLAPLRSREVLLVIYQVSNDAELVRFIERARRELPDTILVTCSSPPFGRLRDRWKTHPETLERYRAFIEASHLNMNVCRATVPWYRAFTDTPSLYLPQPYPVEYAMEQASASAEATADRAGSGQWAVGTNPLTSDALAGDQATRGAGDAGGGYPTPEDARQGPHLGGLGVPPPKPVNRIPGVWRATAGGGGLPPAAGPAPRPILYVAGDTVRPDIMSGHLVAKVLQQRHPELLIRVTKTPEFPLNTSLLRGTRYEVVPFRPWAEQLKALAAVRLVINTDLWWTRGRVPVDCAAAGVPCVGTTSDGQTELWPDLAGSESLEVDELLALAERVLVDQEFRTSVTEKARRRLRNYSYERTVERFAYAIELARSGYLDRWRDPVWEGDVLVAPKR